MAERALLDVGIPTLNDGLSLTDEDDTVFPEVRFAEAIYFSNQLAKVMEKSGAWALLESHLILKSLLTSILQVLLFSQMARL